MWGAQLQPALVAHDEPDPFQSDIDKEMEAALILVFVGFAFGRKRDRHRKSEQAPAPQAKLQSARFDNQCQTEHGWAEPLAQQPIETASAFFLSAEKIAAGKAASPDLVRLVAAKIDGNSPAKPPALPERIEAVLQLQE
jgi:hypothetical protein